MGIKLKPLSELELAACRIYAGMRTAAARMGKSQNTFTLKSRERFYFEETGVIGEYAFCKHNNIFFSGIIIGSDGGVDAIANKQRLAIKSTARPDGNMLATVDTDYSNVDIFILMRVIDYVPEIVGWVGAETLLQKDRIKKLKFGDAYFMKATEINAWGAKKEESKDVE